MDWRNMDKKQLITLVLSSVFIVFGILFCVISEKMLGFIETAVCLALIVYGVFYLLVYCLIDSDTRQTKSVIKGVASLGIGLLIIFLPAFFMIAIGVVIAGYHALLIVRAVKMKNANMQGWKWLMASSITFVVLGVVLIVFASVSLPNIVLMIVLGATLVLIGAYNLTVLIINDRKNNKVVFAQGDTSAIITAEDQEKSEALKQFEALPNEEPAEEIEKETEEKTE